MRVFTLHPNVYSTDPAQRIAGLIRMLEHVWVRDHKPGDGTLFIVSGFGNFNGGVRFFETFKEHIKRGGKIISIFSGSTRMKLTSKQLVTQMLDVGADVHLVNRKRLLHAKCYGSSTSKGERLIVTSGNFTGPGMGLNVEASVLLDAESTKQMRFSWLDATRQIFQQKWDFYRPISAQLSAPAWKLLYDEYETGLAVDESEDTTLLVTLGHADTVRIQAARKTKEARGTQYFWLSRDCYGFFPPLTIRNVRGHKATFSCIVTMHYIDISYTQNSCRVTFEAENNMDFRLGTAPLRHTKAADEGDLAAISRTGESEYELRIIKRRTPTHSVLLPYALSTIGHQGKRYGYVDNEEFEKILGIKLPTIKSAKVLTVP